MSSPENPLLIAGLTHCSSVTRTINNGTDTRTKSVTEIEDEFQGYTTTMLNNLRTSHKSVVAEMQLPPLPAPPQTTVHLLADKSEGAARKKNFKET
jgi:hypothetical protein